MQVKNKKETETKEKIIFKNKGIPKKIQILYLTFAICLFVVSVAGIVGTVLSAQGTLNKGVIIAFVGIMAIGALCFGLFMTGRKIYFNIYENRLEGYSGCGFRAKKVNISLNDIDEFSSNMRGIMPSIIIHTNDGNKIEIIMERNKVIKAEHILRSIWNYSSFTPLYKVSKK